MGFIRTFEEIMAMVGKRAEFYGAEMLTVIWETKPEIIKSLLPPPLKPAEKPIASAFVADYPKTNFSLPYRGSGVVSSGRVRRRRGRLLPGHAGHQ